MIDFGTVKPGTTLYIPFATYDSNDPSASVTITGLATTDIEIYKDGGTTTRASDSGYALLGTDGIDEYGTGVHGISVSLADNTTANFYEAGSQYWVVVASITVDAATINFIAATFRIGYENAVLDTTIATLASQTSFTLEEGSAEDNAYNGMWCYVHDLASAVQVAAGVILDYTGTTKTVTLAADPAIFTMAAGDNISIMGPMPLQPTVQARTLDVTATGAAGLDWGNVENKTTANDLSATDIQLCDTVTTLTGHTPQTGDNFARLGAPAGASVSADIAVIEAQTDDIGIAGAGLTAVAIGVGGIASTSFAAGAIDAAAIAANAIGASEIADGAIDAGALAADAVDEILDDTIGDGTLTVRQALRALVAGMAGKLSGAATTTVTIRNTADTADVIVATVDASGNRTAVTLTP